VAKTAIAKRDQAPPPRVEVITVAKPGAPVGRRLIASPLAVERVIRAVPEGRVVTTGALRSALARDHRADYTCPLTAGIFVRIVAEAAEEDRAAGRGPVAPYWRVVRDDGALLDTLPGGVAAQARALDREGVVVLRLGATPRVTEVDHFAWSPPPAARRPARQHRR
jgi:alkylated DNA nucleotide flippase Atl1